MVVGTLYALAAGLLWGLVFVAPVLLPDYPAALLSAGRYVAFGLIALPLAFLDRATLRSLTRADWLHALELALIGNVIYYALLSAAIQRAGAPLPSMIMGTLPVVIALISNRRDAARDGALPWARLLPSLLLIGAGIACVNSAELERARLAGATDLTRYAQGAALAAAALACWTWYPIRNADWLRAHTDRSPRGWATAQGLVTLPLALIAYLVWWGWSAVNGAPPAPLGPRPETFVAAMLVIALFASWAGTLFWNEASQRLPTALVGQLIVFETLAALAYAFIVRGHWPSATTAAGIALLVAGVMWALRAFR
ncbi:MAG: DMT family transporter [Burkholderiaceae bacterium]